MAAAIVAPNEIGSTASSLHKKLAKVTASRSSIPQSVPNDHAFSNSSPPELP